MKGIEKITARIEADAQAEVEEILRSAREKAEEIRAGYEAQAKAEAADAAQSREKAAQQRLEQAGSELDRLVGVRTRQIQRRLKEVSQLPEEEAGEVLGLPEA